MTKHQEILEELFTSQGTSINLLRVLIGASEFNLKGYRYNDLPPDQSAPTVRCFTMGRERCDPLSLAQNIR